MRQNAEEAKASRDKKFALLRRYMQLLKTTMIAFFLSTCIHVGCVSAYFYTYLYLNPDDPGKKQFYAATTTTPGINIGGKMVGGGGISTNAHKSYAFHLIREHYKGLNYKFFFQFSGIYLLLLIWLKFFSERAQLKKDTAEVFNLNYGNEEQQSDANANYEIDNSKIGQRQMQMPMRRSVLSVKKQLKRKNLLKKKIFKVDQQTSDASIEDQDEDFIEEEDILEEEDKDALNDDEAKKDN